MIDRTARDKFAQDLRQLITGRISNYRFENGGVPPTRDRAVDRIYEDLAYPLYSDPPKHRLIGRYEPTDEVRLLAARAVLFLHSDLEYEWPDYPVHANYGGRTLSIFFLLGVLYTAFGAFLLLRLGWLGAWGVLCALAAVFFLCLGLRMIWEGRGLLHYERWRRKADRDLQTFQAAGDFAVWPFIRHEDFEEAKKEPVFLGGIRNARPE